jgi:hypothetical protein
MKGYGVPEKVLRLDPKVARTHSSFYAQMEAEAEAEAYGDANPAGPIGGGGANHKVTAAIKYNNGGYARPEKVLVLDPKVGRTHTSFYA